MKKYLLPILLIAALFSCKNGTENSNKDNSKNELLAMAMIDNKYGYINTNGEFEIEPQYPLARTFSNGVACVNKGGSRENSMVGGAIGGKYVFINRKNEIQFDNFSSSDPMSFFNDMAIIRNSDNSFSLLRNDGKIIAENFTTLGDCQDNLIPAVKDKKMGYLDKDGNWAIELPYKYFIRAFSEGLSNFSDVDKKLVGYFDTKGEVAIPAQFKSANPFKDGLARVKKETTYGYIKKDGEKAFEEEFINSGDFSDGLCAVENNGDWGFIDKTGKLVIPYQSFDGVREFSEGLCAVRKDNKVGYINKKGETVIPLQYVNGFSFKNGYAIFSTDKAVGFINKKGEVVVEPKFTRLGNFVDPNESNAIFKEN